MSDRTNSLETVATGLGLVYAGLCLLIVSILFPFVGGLFMGPINVMAMAAGLALLAILLDSLGRLFCLAMPDDQAGTKVIIYVSVAMSLGALAIAGVNLANAIYFLQGGDLPLVDIPLAVYLLQTPLAGVGSVLFLLFLRNLAFYVNAPDLAGRALTVLILGVVTVAIGILFAFSVLISIALAMTFAAYYVGPGLLLLAIVLVVMYGNLLTYLRRAVIQYAAVA